MILARPRKGTVPVLALDNAGYFGDGISKNDKLGVLSRRMLTPVATSIPPLGALTPGAVPA
jgi:hypothetical protein